MSTEINQKNSFNCVKEPAYTPRKTHAIFSFPLCAPNNLLKGIGFAGYLEEIPEQQIFQNENSEA